MCPSRVTDQALLPARRLYPLSAADIDFCPSTWRDGSGHRSRRSYIDRAVYFVTCSFCLSDACSRPDGVRNSTFAQRGKRRLGASAVMVSGSEAQLAASNAWAGAAVAPFRQRTTSS